MLAPIGEPLQTRAVRAATATRDRPSIARLATLAGVAVVCFAFGIGLARLLSGSGGPTAVVAVPCEPACPTGHECLQGLCVAPPASMPALAPETMAPATAAAPAGEPVASVGTQRHLKCDGPLIPDAKCDHTSFPKMEYAMYGQAKRYTKCYLDARKEIPDLAGIIKVRVSIDFVAKRAEPAIDKSSNIEHAALRRCVMDAIPEIIDYAWPHSWERMITSYRISFGLRPK